MNSRGISGKWKFVAEVRRRVLGPLVGLREEHPARPALVEVGPQVLEERVRLGEVLAVGALPLVQVGDGVEPHPVHTGLGPHVEGVGDGLLHGGVVEVEVRLVVVEAVPVVLPRLAVPGPVRRLEVLEDDPDVLVALRGVGPDVEVALEAALRGPHRPLEPRVLVGRVVDDELGDDLQPALVCLVDEPLELAHRPVVGVDARVVGDVVAVVAQRRGVERQQPQGGDPEVGEVVELAREPTEVADAVAVGVGEGTHVQLVDDGVLEPQRVVGLGVGTARRGHGLLLVRGRVRAVGQRRRTAKTCAGSRSGSSWTKFPGPCQR
jgi:hypothetical protein